MIIIDSVRMIMYVHQPEKVATCIAMLGFWVSNSLAMELKLPELALIACHHVWRSITVIGRIPGRKTTSTLYFNGIYLQIFISEYHNG